MKVTTGIESARELATVAGEEVAQRFDALAEALVEGTIHELDFTHEGKRVAILGIALAPDVSGIAPTRFIAVEAAEGRTLENVLAECRALLHCNSNAHTSDALVAHNAEPWAE